MVAALAVSAFVFAFLAFLMAGGTLVYVLARRFSTHEVRYGNAEAETRYEYDLPPQWTDRDDAGGPGDIRPQSQPTVSFTQSEIEKRQRLAEMEAALEARLASEDF